MPKKGSRLSPSSSLPSRCDVMSSRPWSKVEGRGKFVILFRGVAAVAVVVSPGALKLRIKSEREKTDGRTERGKEGRCVAGRAGMDGFVVDYLEA